MPCLYYLIDTYSRLIELFSFLNQLNKLMMNDFMLKTNARLATEKMNHSFAGLVYGSVTF